jgi:hypothetical protein
VKWLERSLRSSKRDAQPAETPKVTTSLLPADHPPIDWKTNGEIACAAAEPLVRVDDSIQVARIRYGAGQIVVVASDYVFSNESLDARDTANGLLAFRLVSQVAGEGAVLFDESLNVSGTPKVVGVLFDPLLRPLTVQILVVLFVFAWRGNRRFGGILPVAAPPRHDISDHTDALGYLYYKVNGGAVVLRAYLDQLRSELRLTSLPGQELRVLAPIASRLNTTVEEIQHLLARAEDEASRPHLSRREAAGLIRLLAGIRRASRVQQAS